MLQQAARQGKLSVSDLDQMLPRFECDVAKDPFDDALVVQEILAEPFPGTVAQGLILMFAKEFSGL